MSHPPTDSADRSAYIYITHKDGKSKIGDALFLHHTTSGDGESTKIPDNCLLPGTDACNRYGAERRLLLLCHLPLDDEGDEQARAAAYGYAGL